MVCQFAVCPAASVTAANRVDRRCSVRLNGPPEEDHATGNQGAHHVLRLRALCASRPGVGVTR